MAILVSSFCWPTERRFQCEAVYQVKFLPHDDTSGRFSCLLNGKVTGTEAKVLRVLAEKEWENSFFKSIRLHI